MVRSKSGNYSESAEKPVKNCQREQMNWITIFTEILLKEKIDLQTKWGKSNLLNKTGQKDARKQTKNDKHCEWSKKSALEFFEYKVDLHLDFLQRTFTQAALINHYQAQQISAFPSQQSFLLNPYLCCTSSEWSANYRKYFYSTKSISIIQKAFL